MIQGFPLKIDSSANKRLELASTCAMHLIQRLFTRLVEFGVPVEICDTKKNSNGGHF